MFGHGDDKSEKILSLFSDQILQNSIETAMMQKVKEVISNDG